MEWCNFEQVFHFLYTYAVLIDVCPFTLDEFAQAIHEKVSYIVSIVKNFFGHY